MKETILTNVINLVFTIATAILLPMLAAWLRSKTQNENLRSMITDIENTVKTCVDYTEQVVVSSLKDSSGWTDEAKAKVKSDTITAVIDMLLVSTVNTMTANKIDIEEYVSAKIEAYIQQKKAA